MKYTIKVYKNDKLVDSRRTTKIRRFFHFIQAAKNLEATKYYLCVDYGWGENFEGHKTRFINEGDYPSIDGLTFALRAFTEADD